MPTGYLETKGYMRDMPKIVKAIEMILAINIQAYRNYRFVLDSEPIDSSNIVQGRYFIARWKRKV